MAPALGNTKRATPVCDHRREHKIAIAIDAVTITPSIPLRKQKLEDVRMSRDAAQQTTLHPKREHWQQERRGIVWTRFREVVLTSKTPGGLQEYALAIRCS